jgi:hypothetical protein
MPIAPTLGVGTNLRAQDRMQQLAFSPGLIIPGHDPAVMANFPNPVPGIAKVGQPPGGNDGDQMRFPERFLKIRGDLVAVYMSGP